MSVVMRVDVNDGDDDDDGDEDDDDDVIVDYGKYRLLRSKPVARELISTKTCDHWALTKPARRASPELQ